MTAAPLPYNRAVVARMLALGLVAGALACTGDIEDKSLQGLTPTEAVAKTRWLKDAEPIFQAIFIQYIFPKVPVY